MVSGMGPREILNELKWRRTNGLGDAKVTILHRGAPDDKCVVEGSKITKLDRGFMHVVTPRGEVEIPYHRILKIEAFGRVLWQKSSLK